MGRDRVIAYFSMEIGLESSMPTYAGGLGVLAGDTVRSAADLGLPLVAVSLLARQGYFHQRLDAGGWQSEEPVHWPVDDYLEPLDERVTVELQGRTVTIRAWRYDVQGVSGHRIPVYFLDTDAEENSDADRALTYHLYGGDDRYRLSQEVILGIGGIRMLRALGYRNVNRYHMNEGHSSLLVLELLAEKIGQNTSSSDTKELLASVHGQCIFTTHTPVPSGHDKFPMALAREILGPNSLLSQHEDAFHYKGELNMTYLALANSYFVNGVAKRHREISQRMFSGYHIDSITNGIHVQSWAARPWQKVFDLHIPDWKADNLSLRYAISIPRGEIWNAHQECKRDLIEYVNRITNAGMDTHVFTLGFARRATKYKRADMLLESPSRLRDIAKNAGAIQVIYAGKAHPKDDEGKKIIQRICELSRQLGNGVRVVYLREYDMSLARLMAAGSDVWLNTPRPPMEASGTSGMKAAVNGVPSYSVLDGWWVEGCIEGVTGWAIEADTPESAERPGERDREESRVLYDKLERNVVPMYYNNREKFIDMMRSTIAINGSFFNTERMLSQYIARAYF